MNSPPLTGRLAVVTGGLSGIGAGIVARLRADGATVVVVDVRPEPGGVGEVLRCDVSDEADVQRLAANVLREYGTPDILVNNAGIYPFIPLAEMTFEQWRNVIGVNLDSVFLLCRAFVPGMTERGYGRVVNIATNAFHSGVISDYTAYVASKGGVIGFTRALASEVGRSGVTVNAVAPGLVANGAADAVSSERRAQIVAEQAIGRLAEVADVVAAVAYLVRPEAAFCTGQTLMVDGGMTRL